MKRSPEIQAPPQRACDIELVGEQRDTGFEQKQWLIKRDGRFVQVSELLYRVLEEVDGQRGLESIAARVTDATQWTVAAKDVQALIDDKLVPAGLIASAEAPGIYEQPRRNSPFGVSFRFDVVGPRAFEPMTRPLRWLFAPKILVPVLAGLAIVHLWLYLVHGIGRPIHDLIAHPALILAVMAIYIVTTMFHEIGHASALRYGGGRLRRMGIGLYLIYPVFFTDTTDAYRLGRWARVRIDLGGFYFQLLAGAFLIVAGQALAQQWLIVPAFIINVEALRQLLFPFVRLDGYWLFADLTGIPDFFSHIPAFIKRLVRRGHDPPLPTLKPAVKIVFLAYLVATPIILGVLLVRLLIEGPKVVATAWNSFAAHGASLVHALHTGDLATAAGLLGQLLLLVVPALAIPLLLLVVANWLAATVRRRRRTAI